MARYICQVCDNIIDENEMKMRFGRIIHCTLCGASGPLLIRTGESTVLNAKEGISQYNCRSCGAIFDEDSPMLNRSNKKQCPICNNLMICSAPAIKKEPPRTNNTFYQFNINQSAGLQELLCKKCGGNLISENQYFVCQNCGTAYIKQ